MTTVPINHNLQHLPPRISQPSNKPINDTPLLSTFLDLPLTKMCLELLPNAVRHHQVIDYFLPLFLTQQNLLDRVSFLSLEFSSSNEKRQRLIYETKSNVQNLHEVTAHNFVFLGLLLLDLLCRSQSTFNSAILPLHHFLHPVTPILNQPNIPQSVDLLQNMPLLTDCQLLIIIN